MGNTVPTELVSATLSLVRGVVWITFVMKVLCRPAATVAMPVLNAYLIEQTVARSLDVTAVTTRFVQKAGDVRVVSAFAIFPHVQMGAVT